MLTFDISSSIVEKLSLAQLEQSKEIQFVCQNDCQFISFLPFLFLLLGGKCLELLAFHLSRACLGISSTALEWRLLLCPLFVGAERMILAGHDLWMSLELVSVVTCLSGNLSKVPVVTKGVQHCR